MKQLTNYLRAVVAISMMIIFVPTYAEELIDGIYYNLNEPYDVNETGTAEVTCEGGHYDAYQNEYQGSIIIPSIIYAWGRRYFVTSIDSHAFRGCYKLTSVTLNERFTTIPLYSFYGTGLTSIDMPYITYIGSYAFNNSTLEYVNLGANLTTINEYAFRGTKLKQVVCKSLWPPECENETVFGDCDCDAITLFVPEESIERYRNSAVWCNFGTIRAIPEYPAESITISGEAQCLVGKKINLTTQILPTNTTDKSVKWSISNESIATLKDNGNGTATITGIRSGVVTIVATTTDSSNLSDSWELTIIQPVESITLEDLLSGEVIDNGAVISKPVGESILLHARVLPNDASNRKVIWTSSDDTIAHVGRYTFDQSITIGKEGSAKVTVFTTDGTNLSATCTIVGVSGINTVNADPNVAVEYYDIHGRKLSAPAPGINIVRMSDGTIRKELVK